MANHQTLRLLEQRGLPSLVASSLGEVADLAASHGVALVVFGSFSTGANRRTSDLDIGLVWKSDRNAKIACRIEERLDRLPTVRRVDLVDFSAVSQAFRQQALSTALPL